MGNITIKGKEIYEKLLPTLLPHYPDQYIVIDTTGEYWVNSDLTKALQEARVKYPDKKFYLAKIGAKDGSIAQFA